MKHNNKRSIAALVMVAALALGLTASCDDSKTEDEYLTQAEAERGCLLGFLDGLEDVLNNQNDQRAATRPIQTADELEELIEELDVVWKDKTDGLEAEAETCIEEAGFSFDGDEAVLSDSLRDCFANLDNTDERDVRETLGPEVFRLLLAEEFDQMLDIFFDETLDLVDGLRGCVANAVI